MTEQEALHFWQREVCRSILIEGETVALCKSLAADEGTA